MHRRERRALHRALVLGLLLVLLVAGLDLGGVLAPLEHGFADWRAANFQHFAPRPTDALVHVDIDDPSLELIGKWPWPREVYGQMVDELRVSGAKAAAFDVIFPDASSLEADGQFAAALSKFGKAIIPVSFAPRQLTPRYPAAQQAALTMLAADPTLSQSDVTARLVKSHLAPIDTQTFISLLRTTINHWVAAHLANGAATLDQLQSQLAGGDPSRITVSMHLLEKEYTRQSALRLLSRFGSPVPPNPPPLLDVNTIVPPIAILTEAAGHTAFVDDLLEQDSIRALPVCARCGDRVYNLLGLELALDYLDIDPAAVRLDQDAITIPLPTGNWRLPTFTRSSPYGVAGAMVDVPWFGLPGDDNWQTAFDPPNYAVTRQHIPATELYDPILTRRRIAQNNSQVDEAIASAYELNVSRARADQYMAQKPAPADVATRLPIVDDLLKKSIDLLGVDDLAKVELNTLPEDQKKFVLALRAMQSYRGGAQSLQQQLAEQEATLASALKGKAVLIGSTASAASDVRVTPLWDQTPGVLVHGAIFNAVLTRYALKRAPEWVNVVLAIIMGALAAFLAGHLTPLKAVVSNMAMLGLFLFFNCLVAYDWAHWIFSLAAPTLLCLFLPGTLGLVRFVAERAERSKLRRRFSSYMDPALLEFVEENPDIRRLEGQLRDVSVVFTDLAGFTTLTEKLQERTVGVLNQYLHLMTGIIRHNRGFVNKFLGDGIMSFYNAPRDNPTHAIDAVATVLSMHKAMDDFNKDLLSHGLPPIGMRAGITTGQVIVGDAGGDLACDYTVLGDRVNLAARLESANKQFGTAALISDQTARELGDRFLIRPIGIISVKGKTQAVEVFEPLAEKADAPVQLVRLCEATQAMVNAYIAGDFQKSLNASDVLESEFGPSLLIEVYRDNARANLEHRAADFCGTLVLTEK